MTRPLPRVTAALAAIAVAALAPTAARASQTQESTFQDDDHLIYASTARVNHTLDVLQSLGVDRLRVTIKWSLIAPSASSRTRPSHFNATNPAEYPAANWAPYDRIVRLALAHGIGLNFNITAPGPLWAMRHDAPTVRSADHFAPSVPEFGWFVQALGARYSGTFIPSSPPPPKPQGSLLPVPIPGIMIPGLTPPADPPVTPSANDAAVIPRVHFWTIWNEPNQPGWLAPQFRRVAGASVPNSPRLYRQYVDAAVGALYVTGHWSAKDTILIGELAPEGFDRGGFYTALTPMPFLRALYCVDDSYRSLSGSSARALGCPTSGSRRSFVSQHPGLFYATGFAHHPYYFYLPPGQSSPNPSFVPIANLSRLERGLDRTFANYGVRRSGGIPLYLTEYGYQTNPPDIYQVVGLVQQAAYLNQADFIAWRDPRVRSVSQFGLYDAPPDTRFRPSDFNYWDLFQTGILFANGARKPSFQAYRLPIFVPAPRVSRGAGLLVWGQLRAAPDGTAQQAVIQWRPRGGRFSTIATVTTRNPEGYLAVLVRPPGSGDLRLAWHGQTSRTAGVTVG
jgi:hypothetical protein